MPGTVYLDHAATTPMRPEAVESMLPWMRDGHGNPSGSHRLARAARRAVDDARDELAELVGCRPGEIVFTSGGTEADNLAISGAPAEGTVAVCSAVDHHAVLDPVRAGGGQIVGVDRRGLVDLDQLARVLQAAAPVGLVSVLLAGNEVGTVQDLDAMAAVVEAEAPGALIHTDAVQAFAWLDVPTRTSYADLVSLTGHKFGGPAGVGLLAVREPVRLRPMLLGGGQERGRRSGSLPVVSIVGLAAGARACHDDRKAAVERVGELRDRLADGLLAAITGAVESADRSCKIAANCHLCIPGVEAEALLFLLDEEGVCASAASSCASGAAEPSHVLAALGVPADLAGGSLRLSLGWTTTAADVDRALEVVPAAVERLRGMRVLVAMSGGVDSSVAAAVLAESGHDVTGVTLRLWGGESDTGCCSVSDVDDARRVADQLGLEHHVFNFGPDFERDVVQPYVDDHRAGRTPNPCVECNRHLKFDRLLRRATQLGFDALATGHHARVVGRPGRLRVARGADPGKDQSYVLHMLDQGVLARTSLPIGHLTKAEVRAVAADRGLRTATKPDSQDVCFITSSEGRAAFLGRHVPLTPGRVVDASGTELARVPAVELVTIGQRRRLGLPGGDPPRHVLHVDPAGRTVTVGSADDLLVDRQVVGPVSWAGEPVSGPVLVQCSAHGRPERAVLAPGAEGSVEVVWDKPHRRVAPGQAVVFYEGDEVLGGAPAWPAGVSRR